ncbi:penicillin-binding protein activator [Temperatibacter marinus]|uniref:Penicillin-binding protein activator n=1 Tax=Temperatibacter marinus TaxID=1456591 RepID=A0AA52EDU8_9PROT|nr:penicillin-binding protein activator [Temperatibacter marinus]WND03647.1 penicillin-binding protein activator [Temperatibacter marinus]
MANTNKPLFFLFLIPILILLSGCGGETRPEPKRSTLHTPPPAEVLTKIDGDQSEDELDASAPLQPLLTDTSKINVAVLLPLSGANKEIGSAMLNAVMMALFDSYDPRITLFPFDTKGTSAGAVQAAERAIDIKARIVIGPLLSNNVQAAGHVLSQDNIPLIGLSNDRRVAARNRYLLGFLPESEVDRVVSYALSQNKKKMAALIPENAYGDRVLSRFGRSLDTFGGEIKAVETYPIDADNVQESVRRVSNYDRRRRDYQAEINFLRGLQRDLSDRIAADLARAEQIQEPDFDAILIPEGGDLLRTLVPLLPFYEVDPKKIQFMGTGLMNDPDIMNDPPLQGTWFAGIPPQNLAAFTTRYEQTFNESPPRLASLAYDAMGLVATVLRNALEERLQSDKSTSPIESSSDPIFTYKTLENAQGFMGVNGLFRFLPDGTNERMLAILEINSRGLRVVDTAPAQFPAFGYILQTVEDNQLMGQPPTKEESSPEGD